MITIEIDDATLAQIERHCFSEVRHEVGGVLYGTLDDGAATIAGAFPALKASADQTSVTFTHEVWDEIHERLDSDHAGQRIVGWYHTHPGFGLFLSEYDQFIHRNFFPDPSMVALVVDPVAGQLGWFEWQAQSIEMSRKALTTTPAVASPSAVPTTGAEARRFTVRGAAPALLLVGLALAAGGFFLGSTSQDSSTPDATVIKSTDGNRQLHELQDEATSLRQEVDNLRTELEKARSQSSKTRSTSFPYVVRRGDTLSAIALFLYGDANAYNRIVDANHGLNPNQLEVGQQLLLPVPSGSGD